MPSNLPWVATMLRMAPIFLNSSMLILFGNLDLVGLACWDLEWIGLEVKQNLFGLN